MRVSGRVEIAAIVGRDDRRDLTELVPADPWHAQARAAAPAVAFVTRQRHCVIEAQGALIAATTDAPFDDRFHRQPRIHGATPLTGFLVTRRHLLTAAHGIRGDSRDLIALFDFTPERLALPDTDGVRRYRFEPGRWARITRTIAASEGPASPDYAILELDREPAERALLPCAIDGAIGPGDRVSMIGHPFGQPIKVTIGQAHDPTQHAHVLAREGAFLTTTLDAFRGNSGSPVFAIGRAGVIAVHNRGFADDIDGEAHVLPEMQPGAVATLLSALGPELRAVGATFV